jgi:tetratricopeptide (TPR) repeat protein
MRRHPKLAFPIAVIALSLCAASTSVARTEPDTMLPASSLSTPPAATPAQKQIDEARAVLAIRPGDVKKLNSLAVGLTRRARETGDPSYYDQAWQALEEARRRNPDSLETLRISAWVSMGRHEFAKAHATARRYDRRSPGDPWNLSVLGDAAMELGRYREAEQSYQRMVDLKPGPAAYSRVAYLREARGDLEGALGMMQTALDATDSRECEDRAWLLVQVAHLQDLLHRSEEAEKSYRAALASFPGYHYALAGLSELELRRGEGERAVALARQALEAAPHAERYLLLADALRATGEREPASRAEADFERLALGNLDKPDNENHDLVLYYLERRPDPPRALAIALREATRRKDIHTLDRLALALHACGENRRGRRLMKEVLSVGTRDPLILRHAESIGVRSPTGP